MMLLVLEILNFVLRPVMTWLKLKFTNSMPFKSLLYNLNRQKANLYFIILNGVALQQMLCKLTKEVLLSANLTHIFRAFADVLRSFCFRVTFNLGRCHISKL